MPKLSSRQGPPDLNSIAFGIMEQPTGQEPEPTEPEPAKNPHAAALGRLGGKKAARRGPPS